MKQQGSNLDGILPATGGSAFTRLTVIALVFMVIMGLACDRGKDRALTFSVMGDVPRSEEEKGILREQIAQHNRLSQSMFVVHVGDIKSGSTPCDEGVYEEVALILRDLNVPVFIVPGDNEWNDCTDPLPDQAWGYWEKYFLEFERHWQFAPLVHHQPGQPENYAFVSHNILFIGLNLVGGLVHDQDIWNRKMQVDADWIKTKFDEHSVRAAVVLAQANPSADHDLFMSQFRQAARAFRKPILFIHGDGHVWLHDDPWLEENIVRIQVDKGGIADPLQVTIPPADPVTFNLNRTPFE